MLTSLLDIVTSRMSARPLALARIGIGLVAAIKAVDLGARLPAIATADARSLVPGSDWISPAPGAFALTLWFAASLSLVSGRYARLGAAVIAVLCVAFTIGDVRLYNQHLYLFASLCAALALSECDRDLVVGRRNAVTTVPRWPAFLLMAQLSIVYGIGAAAKLSVDFASGAVLFAVFSRQPIASLAGEWILDATVLIPLSAAVIVTEVFLAVAVWRPGLRGLVLAVAGPFHIGMLAMMPLTALEFVRLAAFGALQLVVLLFLFAPVSAAQRIVVWDDSCEFCATWVRAFRALDWLRAITLIPLSQPARYRALGIDEDAALQALQLREADGTVHSGFEAVRRLAYAFPLTMLLAPWLALPPIRLAGDRAYRRVAARRTCAVVPGAATP